MKARTDRRTTRTTAVVVGPSGHGVVRHALAVAEATGVPVVRRPRPPDPARFAGVAELAGSNVHWHFTDRLFGATAMDAATRFTNLVRRLPARSVVTLHDVPDPDGTERAGRRIAAFERVVAAADAVIVSSEQEADRLRRAGIDADVAVIPLPVIEAGGPSPPVHRTRAGTVAVLGFVYPGKGHADVIDAVGSILRADVVRLRIEALGTASTGHAELVAMLHGRAARLRCPFAVTGHLSDAALTAALCQVDVPVVPARTVSASASMATWIGAGRRPLVARNGYTEEIARFGDVVTLYDPSRPGALADAITWAATDPTRTRRSGPVPDQLTITAVAQAHRRLFDRLAS